MWFETLESVNVLPKICGERAVSKLLKMYNDRWFSSIIIPSRNSYYLQTFQLRNAGGDFRFWTKLRQKSALYRNALCEVTSLQIAYIVVKTWIFSASPFIIELKNEKNKELR